MIKWTLKLAPKVAKAVATTVVYKYAKDRAVWYYHNAINPRYSETMLNLYRVNKMEKQMNRAEAFGIQKKVFHISKEGYIYDVSTGAIYGNIDEPSGNKYEFEKQFKSEIYEEQNDEGYEDRKPSHLGAF